MGNGTYGGVIVGMGGVGSFGTSSLSTWHPAYTCKILDWQQMRDTWRGQRAVKDRGTEYLPPTSGMILDGLEVGGKGWNAYNAYLLRALFHDFVGQAVDNYLGMLWNKLPTFEMPSDMDYLRQKATVGGESLNQALRWINREQLVIGRCGGLVDFHPGLGAPDPYLAMYTGEHILNWDAGFRGQSAVETTNMVVLNESGPKRTSLFGWSDVEQYRVLMLGDPEAQEAKGEYRFGVFNNLEGNKVDFDPALMRTAGRQGSSLDHIPWVFINANSTLSAPCDPPLMGLSDLCLAIYRLEGDYRQALFMQTQDTLFTKGFTEDKDKPLRIGAGGRIHGPTKDADAKWIGVTSEGLPELRTARENDIKMAASMSNELMDSSSRARESGTALEMRIGSKTATLNEIALAGGEGLQRLLRDVARWKGKSESEVEKIFVKANFEFASKEFQSMDLKTMIEAKILGAPVSLEAIHKWSAERGGPGKDLKFEDMVAQIEAEMEILNSMQPELTTKEKADQENAEADREIAEQAQADKAKADMEKAKHPPKPAAAR